MIKWDGHDDRWCRMYLGEDGFPTNTPNDRPLYLGDNGFMTTRDTGTLLEFNPSEWPAWRVLGSGGTDGGTDSAA